MATNYPASVAKSGDMPQTVNLPDRVVELVNLALDPTYDTPDPVDMGALNSGTAPLNPNAPVLDFRVQPSYQQGGMIGPGGQPQRPDGGGMSPQMIEQEVQRILQQHPQRVAEVKQAVLQALQTGELTPQELNMVQQLAMAAAQNPQVYPQIRQFAIQQGLATEQDLPPEYDPGLVFVLLLATRSVQADVGGQNMMQGGMPAQAGLSVPQAAGQPPQGAYEGGGPLPADSRNADGSISITAHEGEYVVPAHVVRAKGTDFFNNMIKQYDERQAPKTGG